MSHPAGPRVSKTAREEGPYRVAPPRPVTRAEPTGEILEPTPEDLGALASIHSRARTRLRGTWVCAGLMLWYAVQISKVPPGPDLQWISAALGIGSVALALYALWSRANPRLVARRAEQGRDGKEIAYEARQVVARGRTVEQGRAARLETEVRIPEDAPTAPRIRWRVEVTVGEPPIPVTARRIRVVPAMRRRGAKPQAE
jgi:hypothetical protein